MGDESLADFGTLGIHKQRAKSLELDEVLENIWRTESKEEVELNDLNLLFAQLILKHFATKQWTLNLSH